MLLHGAKAGSFSSNEGCLHACVPIKGCCWVYPITVVFECILCYQMYMYLLKVDFEGCYQV